MKYYQVAKQDVTAQGAKPEIYVVAENNINHFLHEQLSANSVLIFSEFPERNLYTDENQAD